MKIYKIFTINPGSTSTKVALFENEECLFTKKVIHEDEKLVQFETLIDQLPYRRDAILDLLTENNISLDDVDVFVGRGGGLVAMEGGTYEVSDLLVEHASKCINGVVHPANLGSLIADEFSKKYHAKAMVVNPPDVDELQDLARMTGIKDEYRIIHLHALNLKETAIQHSKNIMKKKYEECNYIVCHIGGGISISAHKHGKMIDGNDIVGGEGPIAPTRCGSISVVNLISLMEKKNLSPKDLKKYCTRTGGLTDLTGVSDAIELTKRANNGDQYAKMVWNSMIYQIEKWIGSMAAVLHGDVDAILLGGGLVYSEDLVNQISQTCGFIAPVYAYPGEFEMEAMASGAIRVLNGEEELKQYTGKPVWTHFDF
ncbi:MAG: butyrate kinase [Erysipelotrichaceae bacterium]|nr:butyrate kinase [Erysipelotrichaceae bacterium]